MPPSPAPLSTSSTQSSPAGSARWVLVAGVIILVLFRFGDLLGIWSKYGVRPIFGRDFRGAYYAGAAAFRAGFYNIYDAPAFEQWQVQHGLTPYFPAEYPPLTYVVFLPFTNWTPEAAQTLFLALNHVLAVGSVLVLLWAWPRGRGAPPDALDVLAWSALALFASPTLDALTSGQIGLVQSFLVAGFAALYLRGRGGWAAWPLALAISLKITPALLLVYLLIRKDFRTVGATLGLVAAMNAAALLALGSLEPLTGFLSHASNSAKILLAASNQSIPCLVARNLTPNDFWPNLWSAPGLVNPLSTLLCAGLLGVTVAAVLRPPCGARGTAVQLAPFLLLQLLCSARSWPSYYGFALVAAVLFWLALREGDWGMDNLLAGATRITLGIAFLGGEISSATWQLLLRMYLMAAGLLCLATLGLWWVMITACRHMPDEAG